MKPSVKPTTFGEMLKQRREQLGLSRAEVAQRSQCQPNHIAYLEVNQRRPSPSLVRRLAATLDLDPGEVFFQANPEARELIAPKREVRGSVWERFKTNRALHTRHGISKKELAALEGVAMLGAVRTQRDFLFILQAIRQALTEE